jgi:hypothetical protein
VAVLAPALRLAVRALAPPPGRGPLGGLRRAALALAMPALVRARPLSELLETLDGAVGLRAAGAVQPRRTEAERRARGESARVLAALGRWHPNCLCRALTGFASLSAGGASVTLLIGVRVDGGELTAHAWLEQDGEPLGERTDPRSRFAVAFAYPGERAAAITTEDGMTLAPASTDVILTELKDGTGVLLDLRTKFYFTLNRTGVAVWKLLAAGAAPSAEAVAETLAQQFAAPELDRVRRDVEALLAELEKEGLLARARGPAW